MSPSWRLMCFRSQTDPQELLQGLTRVIDGGHLSYLEDDRAIVWWRRGAVSPLFSGLQPGSLPLSSLQLSVPHAPVSNFCSFHKHFWIKSLVSLGKKALSLLQSMSATFSLSKVLLLLQLVCCCNAKAEGEKGERIMRKRYQLAQGFWDTVAVFML